MYRFLNWALNNPSKNDKAEWYFLGDWPWSHRRYGNLYFHFVCGAVFTVLAFLPVAGFALQDWLATKSWGSRLPDVLTQNPTDWAQNHKIQFVVWLVAVMGSLPLFMWQEARRFEAWLSDASRATVPGFSSDVQKRWFEVNAKHVESFWKTVGSFLLTAGIIGLAKSDKSDPQLTAIVESAKRQADELSKANAKIEGLAQALAVHAAALNEAMRKQSEETQTSKASADAINALVSKLDAMVRDAKIATDPQGEKK